MPLVVWFGISLAVVRGQASALASWLAPFGARDAANRPPKTGASN